MIEYGRRELSILHGLGGGGINGAFDFESIARSRQHPRYMPPTFGLEIQISRRRRFEYSKDPCYWIPFRIIDLKSGPQPRAWKLFWAPELECFVRDFWSWAGNEEPCERSVLVHVPMQRTAMPGAWDDDGIQDEGY